MRDPVLAIQKFPNNGHLIAACARLGYLKKSWLTLDPTYGYGTFWKVWKPRELVACDLNPDKSPIGFSVDFTDLPWEDRTFMASVYDGPYKLNGKPSDSGGVDERFGVEQYTRWQDRMALLVHGAVEVARVTEEYMLVKCQDQVVSSKIRWQTRILEEVLELQGFGLKDRFEYLSRRAQPKKANGKKRKQKNAHRCSSQLLVFKRGWSWRH
jgi:hypothetical protein